MAVVYKASYPVSHGNYILLSYFSLVVTLRGSSCCVVLLQSTTALLLISDELSCQSKSCYGVFFFFSFRGRQKCVHGSMCVHVMTASVKFNSAA